MLGVTFTGCWLLACRDERAGGSGVPGDHAGEKNREMVKVLKNGFTSNERPLTLSVTIAENKEVAWKCVREFNTISSCISNRL